MTETVATLAILALHFWWVVPLWIASQLTVRGPAR